MRARENPYRSERILQIRYRFQDSSLEEIENRLRRCDFRAAIVGPEGTGKTTLLEDLQEPLAKAGKRPCWFRLTREFPRFSRDQLQRIRQGFSEKDLILFDGAETLGWFRFQVFRWQTRKAGGLIITTHRPGYLPTLLRSRTSPALLGAIMQTLDSGTVASDPTPLFRKHRGNLREALREMYDVHMNRPLPKA